MAKLSLALRKNIRDNEPKLKEATTKLAAFAGGEVTVEVDWEKFNTVLSKDSSYADRAGEGVEWIVSGLAGCWEYNYANDEEFKQTLAAAWKTKKLIVETGYKRPSGGPDHGISIRDGSLVVGCDDGYIVSNVSYVGTDADKRLGLVTAAGHNLSLSKNIREYKPQIEEKIKEIVEASGVSGVTFNVDWNKWEGWIQSQPDNAGSGYENRAAEVAFWVIGGLADNIKSLCGDAMVKEALQEAWKGEIILSQPNPKLEDYHVTELKDGKMTLKYRSPNSNVGEVGKDIEKRL